MKKLLYVIMLAAICVSPLIAQKAPAGLKLPVAVSAATSGDNAWSQSTSGELTSGERAGILSFPAWFSDNRPARGEMVVLEFEYLDNFDTPVSAQVFSGMDTERGGWFEVHQFGGRNDGNWYKVRVPAPADLIFRSLDDNTIRFRLNTESGPLTIRSPQLTAPRADDEANWNAETREWVSREQNERAKINPIYWQSQQKPYLQCDWDSRPLVVFQRNWMELIEPRSAPQPGETAFPANVRIFTNEYQPLQLGVFANGKDLSNIKITVDPIRETALDFTVRVAEYSIVHSQLAGYFLDYFPQRLWPAFPFGVKEGQSHLVLIDFKTTDGKSQAGTYKTNVHFSADGIEPVSVTVEIEVMPLRILTMEEARLKLGGCVTGLIPEYEMEKLRTYNHNMINIWYAGVHPGIEKKAGGFDLDWRVMDDFMLRAHRQGFSDIVYFLGGNPPLYPRTMHWPRTIAESLHGIRGEDWEKLSFENPYEIPPILVDEMVEWARRFGEHATSNPWPNVVLTPFDEPAKQEHYFADKGNMKYIKDQFIKQTALLRKGWPEAEIYGSIHHYYGGIDFLPYVDVFCTNAIAENWKLGEEVRDAGKTFWQYSGTGDNGLPARARYTFGYYFGSQDSRGSLVWAYNWGKRYDTIDGSNWMYVWNTPFDLIPAPYMIGLREAWDDRRLRETVRQLANEKDVDLMAFWGRLHKEAAQERGRGGTNTLDDFWETARDDNVMEGWKSDMIHKALWLKKQ